MILGLTSLTKIIIAAVAWAGVWYLLAIPFWGGLMREIENRGGFDRISRRSLTVFFLVVPAAVPLFALMIRRRNRRAEGGKRSS